MFWLYKNNDNIENFNNYKSVKLLSHDLKVWKKIVDISMRKEVSIF